jgi:hypothetical protein
VKSLDPSIIAGKYISACESVLVEITGVSFVDDTGLGVTSSYVWDTTTSINDNYKAELWHTLDKLHSLAQHWEHLLYTTGGGTQPTKKFLVFDDLSLVE